MLKSASLFFIIFPSTLLANAKSDKQFRMQFFEAPAGYTLTFDQSGLRLVGEGAIVRISRSACTAGRIHEFRNDLERRLTKHTVRLHGAKKTSTLVVHGVTTKLPQTSQLAKRLRRIPSDVFALRWQLDKSCAKGRTTASEGDVPAAIQALDNMNKPAPTCTNCAAGQEGQNREDCLRSLCPENAFSAEVLTEKALRSDPANDPVFKHKCAPVIDRILALEELEQKRNAELNRQIKAGRRITQQTDLRILEMMRRVFEVPHEAWSADDGGHMRLDERVLKRLRPGWTAERVERARTAFALMGEATRTNPVVDSPVDRLEQVFSREAVKEHIRSGIAVLRSRWAALPQEKRDAMGLRGREMEAELTHYESLVQQDTIPNRTTGALHQIYRAIFFVENVEKIQGAPTSLRSDQILAELTRNFRENVESAYAGSRVRNEDLRARCASAFAVISTYSPTASEVQAIRAQERDIIDRFLKSTSSLLSSHSNAAVKTDSQRWSFAFAPTRDVAVAGFQSTLESYERLLKTTVGFNPSEFRGADVIVQALNDSGEESQLTELCSKVSDLIRDAAYDNPPSVYVSPVVAKLWPKTSSIVNHELGHLLDYALKGSSISEESKKKKSEIDLCLMRQHAPFANATAVSEDYSYTAENWADFAGYHADKGTDLGFECLFLQAEDAQGSPVSLDNRNGSDTHAGDWFRALHRYSFFNATVPPACRAALGESGQSANFKNCRNPQRAP